MKCISRSLSYRRLAFGLLVMLTSLVATAQSELNSSELEAIKAFQAAIQRHDADWVGQHAMYPIQRDYPLPAIMNYKQLVARFDTLFDPEFSQLIAGSNPATDWGKAGWRGIMYGSGELWLEETGVLKSVNHQSAAEAAQQKALIDRDRKGLHASLQQFVAPVCSLTTDYWRIRIDEVANGAIRVAVWAKQHGNDTRPGLVLGGGIQEYEGSGGNHYYEWRQGNAVYRCDMILMGEDGSPDAEVSVLVDDQEAFRGPASRWNPE